MQGGCMQGGGVWIDARWVGGCMQGGGVWIDARWWCLDACKVVVCGLMQGGWVDGCKDCMLDFKLEIERQRRDRTSMCLLKLTIE
jgi:hypothetical protein